MEDAEQQVLEMLISGDHAGEILEVGRELLQLHHIVRLDVVPTPHELVERLLLALLVRQHFGVSLRVVHLPQLLQGHLVADDLPHPFVCVYNALVPAFVHFAPQIVEESLVGHLALAVVGLDQVFDLLLGEEDFAALQAPPEVMLVKHSQLLCVQATQNFVQESHAVDAAFSQQMLHLLLQGEFVDHFVFNDGLVELLVSCGSPKNQP